MRNHSPHLLFRESIADYATRDALLRHSARIGGRVLDLGCGRSPYREAFNGRADWWVGVDRPAPGAPQSRADLYADALELPLADETFDTLLCTQVLEHVREPLELLREARRVLKPGGWLLLTAPQYNALHEEPRDFFRFTRYGLEHLARKAGFEVHAVEPIGGFVSLFAFITTIHFAPLRLRPIYGLWQSLAWHLDRLLYRPKDCIGYLLVATRPSSRGERVTNQNPGIANGKSPGTESTSWLGAEKVKPATITLHDERTYPETADQVTFQHHLARYQFALERMAGGERVLDAGCGTGYGSHLLSQKAGFTIGADYSLPALEYAQGRYVAPNLAYAVMNCHRLALRGSQFDLVISFEVFEHLEDPLLFLRECHRVLRPGGRLILSTPNRAAWEIHMRSIKQDYQFHVNLVDLDQLRRFLSRFFPQFAIYGQWRRGNWLHTTLRALDFRNLRLRLFSPQRREKMQQALGVPCGEQAGAETWVFRQSQLRQANHFVAICQKEA